ncbi:hypothetical protein MTR67_031132 [Solanum verrucosum]|uniref:Uncharacterized protein n=1 Tax=Solanum verrucosum TaxID=315347 RepID=A0AAF0U1W0_SOLVR|nr:hypothetical protein MTR67_031132 [Solanum verrucosum]
MMSRYPHLFASTPIQTRGKKFPLEFLVF